VNTTRDVEIKPTPGITMPQVFRGEWADCQAEGTWSHWNILRDRIETASDILFIRRLTPVGESSFNVTLTGTSANSSEDMNLKIVTDVNGIETLEARWIDEAGNLSEAFSASHC
jgi:hypothetical protein